MVSEDGTRPLSPEALAEINRIQQQHLPPSPASLSNHNTVVNSTEDDEVTLRDDHQKTITDNETILGTLSELGCTATTLEAFATSQINTGLWIQILSSNDADQTLQDSLHISCGITRARIKVRWADDIQSTAQARLRNTTTTGYDKVNTTSTKRAEVPKMPSDWPIKRMPWQEYGVGIIGFLECAGAPQLAGYANLNFKKPHIFKQSHQMIQLSTAHEVTVDGLWANEILSRASRAVKRLLLKETNITWHGKRSGLAMTSTLGLIIMARTPAANTQALKDFLSWPAAPRAESLADEMTSYDISLNDLLDHGHDMTPQLQSFALESMTKAIRGQDRHKFDLSMWWAQLARVQDPEEKLSGQLASIEATVLEYSSAKLQTTALAAAATIKNWANRDGSLKICFSHRETGKCRRKEAGEHCGFFHTDFAKAIECNDAQYLLNGNCSNNWMCPNKHSKSRKVRAMKATRASGQMMLELENLVIENRSTSETEDQLKAEAAIEAMNAAADLADELEDFYDEPEECQVCSPSNIPTEASSMEVVESSTFTKPEPRTSTRENRGIPPARFIDTTDYDDMMIADVPREELSAALEDSVSSVQIQSSEGSNIDSSERDSTFSSDHQEGYSSDCSAITDPTTPQVYDGYDSADSDNSTITDDVIDARDEDNQDPCDTELIDEMGNLSLAENKIPGFSRIDKNAHAQRKISFCEKIDFFGNDPLDIQGANGAEPRPLDHAVTLAGPERALMSADCVRAEQVKTEPKIEEAQACDEDRSSAATDTMVDHLTWAFDHHSDCSQAQEHERLSSSFVAYTPRTPAVAGGFEVTTRGERDGELTRGNDASWSIDTTGVGPEVCMKLWDASTTSGAGRTLIDSGASRHILGRHGMKYAKNVRTIAPVTLTTANGEVMLNLEGDVQLKDGTTLYKWLLNKHSETNLCSEGLSNSDVNSGIKFLTPDASGPKVIRTDYTETSALQLGVLNYLPDELQLTKGDGEDSKLVTDYEDIHCCFSADTTQDYIAHQKAGHYPKMKGCPVCERAFAQRLGARKGGLFKGNRLNTLNVDLIDWGVPDNNGHRYTTTAAVVDSCFPAVRNSATKTGATISNEVEDIIAEINQLSDPAGVDSWHIERLMVDQGSEFKGQLKLYCKDKHIQRTTGEEAHHTSCAVIENFNKMLEYCCTALALTGLESAEMAIQLHGELASHATDLIRLRSLTPFQKNAGISAFQEQAVAVPDSSVLTRAAIFSLAYGLIKKSDRKNKLAERAYAALFVGWDKTVKNAARLVPFERLPDGTVKFFKTKVTLSYKIFDGVYPCARGADIDEKSMDTSTLREWVSGDELGSLETEADQGAPPEDEDQEHEVEMVLAHNRFGPALEDIEYQIRFKGCTSDDDLYVPVTELDCGQLIEAYWRTQLSSDERYGSTMGSMAFSIDEPEKCAKCEDVTHVLCTNSLCMSCCEERMCGCDCLPLAWLSAPDYEMHQAENKAERPQVERTSNRTGSRAAVRGNDVCDARKYHPYARRVCDTYAMEDHMDDFLSQHGRRVLDHEAKVFEASEEALKTEVKTEPKIERSETCDSIAVPSPDGIGETIEQLNTPCKWIGDCNDHDCEVDETEDETKAETEDETKAEIYRYSKILRQTEDETEDETKADKTNGFSDLADEQVRMIDDHLPRKQWQTILPTIDSNTQVALKPKKKNQAKPQVRVGWGSEIATNTTKALLTNNTSRSMNTGALFSVTEQSMKQAPSSNTGGAAKRGELSTEEALSPDMLERTIKGLERELNEMTKRRFIPDSEAEISEDEKKQALAARFVWTVKDPDSADWKVKCRLVAKDLKCKRFVDTSESYAGVPSLKAFRLLLASMGHTHVSSADLITAYLQANGFKVGETLVIKFFHPIEKRWIYKRLSGFIYGCITAGAAWQVTFREWMISMGFTESMNATSVYSHPRGVTVSCFVDDPIIFSVDKESEDWYHKALSDRFDVKHHTYLKTGLPITYCGTQLSLNDQGELKMDNESQVGKMLEEAGLTGCNPVRVPVTRGTLERLHQSKLNSEFLGPNDSTLYRSGLGQIHWLVATTHPKLSVAHSMLAKYSANPVNGCLEALKSTYRYISGAKHDCLTISGVKPKKGLELFTDSDWAGTYSIDGECASRSGGVIKYNDVPIDWWSSKQTSIATSSGDAESRALATGVTRGLQLQYIAEELHIQTPPSLAVYADADAAIGFAKHNGGATRMKHIDIREAWVQVIRDNKRITILKIAGSKNPADFFTKVMAKTEFDRASAGLNGSTSE